MKTVKMTNKQGAIANPQASDKSKWENAGWWVVKKEAKAETDTRKESVEEAND